VVAVAERKDGAAAVDSAEVDRERCLGSSALLLDRPLIQVRRHRATGVRDGHPAAEAGQTGADLAAAEISAAVVPEVIGKRCSINFRRS
jgi:hypothetical protein